jgi:uncharacterized glyoxalase superfamily protein PhnB
VVGLGCSNGKTEAPTPAPFDAVAQQCRDKQDLGCPRPIFGVKNLRASLAYYRDALGFKIDWEWPEHGDRADFASVTRGNATLFLGQSPHGGDGALWVFAKHVDKLHDELRKKGATIKMPPTDMPWGARELHVIDRDGNLIRFGGPGKH